MASPKGLLAAAAAVGPLPSDTKAAVPPSLSASAAGAVPAGVGLTLLPLLRGALALPGVKGANKEVAPDEKASIWAANRLFGVAEAAASIGAGCDCGTGAGLADLSPENAAPAAATAPRTRAAWITFACLLCMAYFPFIARPLPPRAHRRSNHEYELNSNILASSLATSQLLKVVRLLRPVRRIAGGC